MITITVQELMALSGPSLYWSESAQVAINLTSASSDLLSRLLSSIYSNLPFVYLGKEQAEVGKIGQSEQNKQYFLTGWVST